MSKSANFPKAPIAGRDRVVVGIEYVRDRHSLPVNMARRIAWHTPPRNLNAP
jgi:hypothetical protein